MIHTNYPLFALCRIGGAYSPWWLDYQPDNGAFDGAQPTYEYCATLALYRDQPNDPNFIPLGLNDRLCNHTHYFVCEVSRGEIDFLNLDLCIIILGNHIPLNLIKA